MLRGKWREDCLRFPLLTSTSLHPTPDPHSAHPRPNLGTTRGQDESLTLWFHASMSFRLYVSRCVSKQKVHHMLADWTSETTGMGHVVATCTLVCAAFLGCTWY